MAREISFDPEDEEFFGTVGSFGVPKFDNEMRGGVPRGFTMIAFTDTGSGSELFAKQFELFDSFCQIWLKILRIASQDLG